MAAEEPAMRLGIGIAALLALALAAPAARAAKPKPPLCAPGRFVVEAAASPLVPGGAAVPDELTLGQDRTLALASGCPAVAAKQKGARKGNELTAKWTRKKGVCTGLAKSASLKATFDPACNALAGSFRSKGVKRTFTARRLPEGLGSPALAPTLDAARAVAKSVGPAGGEVRARGADGTKYVLLVPPGALAAEVAITMTPATAVGGLPLTGGLVGAVELEPGGLRFALPAELELIPPGGLPDLAAAFSGTGPANTFAVELSWPDSERRFASLALEHFSLYGLAIPGPTQLAPYVADLEAIWGLSEIPFAWDEACTDDPVCWEEVVGGWYDLEVGPRIETGSAGPAQALSGNEALLVWRAVLEAVAILGHPSPWPESVTSQLTGGLAQNHANLLAQITAYTEPACSGAVSGWEDWLRIPDEIGKRAEALYEGAQLAALDPTGRYCVALAVRDISFPEEVAEGTTSLPLSFRTVVEAPGGDVGIASQLVLVYNTENASGPSSLVTASDGSASLTVTRAVGTPLFVEVLFGAAENTLGREELVTDGRAAAGSLGLAFEADFDPAPQAYLEPLGSHEVCVLTTVEPFAGQTVSFFLDGPGDIAPAEAVTVDDLGRGRACIEYLTPEAPVAKDIEALLTATLVAGGQTYQDTLHLHPAWVDVRLHADVGEGWVPATNQTLDAEGEGPFDLRGTFTMNPPLVGDPPPYPPFAQQVVTAETDETTLRRLGTVGLFKSIGWSTDALGRLDLEWDGVNADQTVSTITFLAADIDDLEGLDPVAAASMTLDRGGLPDMTVQFPSVVLPGVATPLVVTVYRDGEPAEGYLVELEASGGTVAPASGNTDVDGQLQASATLAPGQTLLTLTVTLREDPGGPVLDQQVVEAAEASDEALVVLVDRRDQCGGCGPVLLGPRVGPLERDGSWTGGGTSSLDSDVQTADGTLGGTVTTLVADGSGSQDEPSPVNPFAHFRAEFRVEAPVLATFSFSATGESAAVYLNRLDGSGAVLGCAPLGSQSYCPDGEPSAGTLELAPGLYAVSGQVFYQGTSFHLEIGFAAP
jgi:hypothetical protein